MMKQFQILFTIFFLFTISQLSAQSGGGHHMNPDSLQLITVSGIAIVDTTSMMHPVYFIDTDNNGEANYFLNFGPWWYEPDSSNGTRPNDGDQITIDGGLWEDTMFGEEMIVVYDINGEYWRDPLEAFWNNCGNYYGGGHFNNGCYGYSWGWMNDSLTTVTVSGIAIVDTTFLFEQFYLDENSDGIPDYWLNFGPPWYDPGSGATRPNDGDQITIVGGKFDLPTLDRIIVFEINGLFWRDSTDIYPHFGGGWCQRNMTQPVQIETPFDNMDRMQVNPGWGGMMMPQQIFCQILELDPQDIPFTQNENILSGYEIGIYNPMGMNMLWEGGGCGGMLNFNSNINYQLHYSDYEMNFNSIDENTLVVKYWNQSSQSWSTFQNPDINTTTNTITLSSYIASNFILITGSSSPTAIQTQDNGIVNEFMLGQNYPNPFNPSTTINFSVPKENTLVSLKIYNSIGQEVRTLINQVVPAGNHEVKFDASGLSTGVYFYTLTAGKFVESKKMILMK